MYDHFTLLKMIDTWLMEDIGQFDLTAQLMVAPETIGTFVMNAREAMTVSGVDVAAAVFSRYAPQCQVTTCCRDGDTLARGDILLSVTGPAQYLLTAERTALNIVQRLSGIATETARYVRELDGTGVKLLDTRKTTPGLRMLEKHAAYCGGALNHRLALDSGIMLKDNHIAVSGGITAAVARARALAPTLTRIEVECDRLEQVHEAVATDVDIIMLDNMSLEDMREAVRVVNGRAKVEASGGITFETIRAVAQTGVDYVSSSRPFQSARAVDIGLDEPKAVTEPG
ncbi:carboxylating nicotinate-nucleotide diphosphorylase [Acetobacter sp. TBRC 12305]|uniref:Probable nicotinate-nucleotide pyrophosphorylase [carboxylating] n=1 Tax=Acetobacter garciniae TaxID=2817435 RepID=A0A939HL52_9PROT|nr:carboxylating nicotinate-nucleotide diphosphorylase [Acetobacter garciniae]MBO1325517.1 carboxylating nicotinate-nucleotide diphosphorylase [Acetobacter garciniae]MBX0345311.1 carboxylating nicotinate-nucleotide diphosphorylase [Acetobacter garciniae]